MAEIDLAGIEFVSGATCLSPLKAGEADQAATLWRRYHRKLIVLAQQRLRMSPQRLADEQDVVVSAFRSFFRAVREERVNDEISENELWRLLVTLTTRKSIKLLRHEGRRMRDARALASNETIDGIATDAPSPEFAAALAQEFRLFSESLSDDDMRMLAQLRMEGYSNTEIAQQLDCSVRTVKRRLTLMRALLTQAINAQGA